MDNTPSCAPTTLSSHYTNLGATFFTSNFSATGVSRTRFRFIKRQSDPFTILTASGVRGVSTVQPLTASVTGSPAFDSTALPLAIPVTRTRTLTRTPTITNTEPLPTFSVDPKPTVHVSASRSNTPVVLIGGVVGGLAFFVLLLGVGLLHLRHRKKRVHVHTGSSSTKKGGSWKISVFEKINRSRQAVTSGLHAHASSYRHHLPDSAVLEPWLYNSDPAHHSQGGKQERVRRVHREIEEARRLRETFQLDLDSLSSRDGSEIMMDSSRGDIGRLGQQIREMSATIATLQLDIQRLMEEQQPPDYSSAV